MAVSSLEEALYIQLISDYAISLQIGRGVYPLSVEGPSAPYVVYEVTGGADDFTRSGYSGLQERRVTLMCVASPYDDAVALARKVKAAMPLWGATQGSVRLHMIRLDNERDYYAAGDGSINPVGRQLDYTIKFSIS